MAGSQLFLLHRDRRFRVLLKEFFHYRFPTESDRHDDSCDPGTLESRYHVVDQGAPNDTMKHFRERTLHACSLSRGKDYRAGECGVFSKRRDTRGL